MTRHPNRYIQAVRDNREILESYSVQELIAEGYHWGQRQEDRDELIEAIACRVARAEYPGSVVYGDC